MKKPKDISGLKFGKLTAIKLHHIEKRSNRIVYYWTCKCDCGNEKVINKQSLTSGNTKSCGCSSHPEVYNYNDIVGKKFGRLKVLNYSHRIKRNDNRHYNVYYNCICDCGKSVLITRQSLVVHGTLSCGCLRKEFLIKSSTTHGLSYHRLHRIWDKMKHRCFNPNSPRYKDYGGRGIYMCNEWENDFKSFYDWAMANGYKDGLTIDRIDVNGDYEPNNCRWADRKTQGRNTRTNHLLTYKDETLCISEWAERIGMKADTLWMRIKRGWSTEKALTTPLIITRKW